ncbi:MAG: hypothetical protein JXA74_03640, partial [Anaerolineae bacterium]|nr:hypothetical protein [Anaerolineae bacterium]
GCTLLDLLLGAHLRMGTLGEAQVLPCELRSPGARCGSGLPFAECPSLVTKDHLTTRAALAWECMTRTTRSRRRILLLPAPLWYGILTFDIVL